MIFLQCPGGEIGRHARFRFWCREVCRFESYPGYFLFMISKHHQSVSAFITNSVGEVLAILRRDVPIWVLPGGGVDAGETPEEAVIREVQEETGLKVEVEKLLAIYKPKGPFAERTFFYSCKIIEGVLKEQGEETLKAGFFPLKLLPKPFLPFHQEWIDDIEKTSEKPYLGIIDTRRPLQILMFFMRHPLIIFRYLLSKCGFDTNS